MFSQFCVPPQRLSTASQHQTIKYMYYVNKFHLANDAACWWLIRLCNV